MKIESCIHKIVSNIIEITCVIILVLMGYFIWDTIAIQRSARVDNYIKDLKPTINEETKEVDLSALQQINPDVVGWLTLDNTTIDYPVMQGGAMFGAIDYYENEQYFNEHLTGTLITEKKIYNLTVKSLIYTDAYNEIYKYHDNDILNAFVKDKNSYEIKVGNMEINDKTLLLSTCGPNGSTDRIILILNMEER